MPGTFDDQAQLAQLFQQAYSPISTYGQGSLALAMQERQDRVRMQQATQLEQMRAASEERAIGLHSKARIAEEKARYEMESEAVKKQRREDALAQARASGISKDQLPDDASYTDILTATTKSHGRELVESAKAAGAALSEYARFRGETVDQVGKRAIAMAIGGVTAKELKAAGVTQQDLNAWLANPKYMDAMLIKAARDKNEKASTLLNRLNSEASQNIQTGMMDAEKYNPKLTGLSERFKLAHSDFMDLRKRGGVDEASSIQASQELVTDALAPKETPAEKNPNFSSLDKATATKQAPGTSIPGAAPSQPNPFSDFWYNPGAPAPGLLEPTSNVNAPAAAVSAPIMAAPPVLAPTPGVATNPSVLSALRLQKFLRDSSANNNALFPTAYPTPDLLSPSAP